ncbi:hypothetical protein ACWZHB_01265 [Nocardia sp. FBN12]
MGDHIDLTPDVKGLVAFARQVLKESAEGSKSAEAAREILRDCGVTTQA